MEMNFVLPTRMVTGSDCVIKNAALLAEYGKKCIIVTGKNSAKKSGALDDMTKALGSVGIEWCVFDGIEQNPSYASCKKASSISPMARNKFCSCMDESLLYKVLLQLPAGAGKGGPDNCG